ncbi:amino acid permease [Apiospora arundinis]|uniref:Choline transporter Hnm1 n=1 Tax=Apiospora arundinis TaxID=335852 RepID=A0ABR2J451_9PEZI
MSDSIASKNGGVVNTTASVEKQPTNADELRLAQMGHTQELKRHFTILSLIGLASTTTISWTGLGLGIVTEINAGGPGAIIYGFILVTFLQSFLGASLGEFVSSYPTEGGMYHWIAAVAPKKMMAFLSFITGWFTCFGWIFTTASTNLIYAQTLAALIALYHADLELQTWQTFIIYQGLNLATACVVMFGNRIIPALNRFSLFYLQLGWLAVLVTVVACAPTHQSPEFVFKTWVNNTGWENQVICFITGLVNPLYSLGGLDGVTHITEEMPNPSRNAPLAIAITLTIAFCTGLTYLIALMFSVQDYAALASTQTGLPLAELFRQVTRSSGGAFGLTFILFVALGPCVVSSQLSTSRVLWAFARDDAVPFSRFIAKVSPRFGVPLNAQLAVAACVAALGCLYLGSSTAFNSMLGAAVTINNVAYLIPIGTNMLTGRRNMHRGHFYLKGVWGWVVNGVTVGWLLFAIVFFSFPYSMPVAAASMNYTCVVVGALPVIILAWWFVARADYKRKISTHKEEKH